MELISVRIEESPLARRRVRLVGDVVYDDSPGAPESYWFEVGEEHAASLSLSGNPWLACLLPLAATLGEDLRLGVPVDPTLAEGAARILKLWTQWYRRRFPELRAVTVHAGREPSRAGSGPRETAAFFSGGIDSFYTVLRNAETTGRAASPKIDRLLWVGGFDLPLEAPEEEFRRLRGRLAQTAEELGKSFLDVRTNLRTLRFRVARWGQVSHGGALASVALALEPRFQAVYVAATHESGVVRPWGSHPETDPLLSTSVTRFIHDGAGIRRSLKTEYVSRSEVAMRSLHVCFLSGSADNCCDCRKCYLAILNLEIIGALSRCSVFPRPLDLSRVRRIYLRGPAYQRLYRDLELRARAAGRPEIARAIAACRRRSRILRPMVRSLDWMRVRRGLWRIARHLRPAVLRRVVR